MLEREVAHQQIRLARKPPRRLITAKHPLERVSRTLGHSTLLAARKRCGGED